MVSINDLQAKIIHLINSITDINQLNEIHSEVHSRIDIDFADDAEDLPWKNSIAILNDKVSFEQLVEDQGERSISFEELQQLSEGIEWNCTLNEILEVLD